MDRLRKSFRNSLKRGSKNPGFDLINNQEARWVQGTQWQADEIAVRSGICSFQVKYLGSLEITSSRGSEVCENAFKSLKASKQKSIRAVLYISSDGLRVVDEKTRGLILDQTVEKVSYCAPISFHDRGFVYICRDSVTQRWLCQGFTAVSELGDRLCHAVGCAFTVCLENKRKRESERQSLDGSKQEVPKTESQRKSSIIERLLDPQRLKPISPPPPSTSTTSSNPFAIARPQGSDMLMQRQSSLKGFGKLQSSGVKPFKRQFSLKSGAISISLDRQRSGGFTSFDNEDASPGFELHALSGFNSKSLEEKVEPEEDIDLSPMIAEVSFFDADRRRFGLNPFLSTNPAFQLTPIKTILDASIASDIQLPTPVTLHPPSSVLSVVVNQATELLVKIPPARPPKPAILLRQANVESEPKIDQLEPPLSEKASTPLTPNNPFFNETNGTGVTEYLWHSGAQNPDVRASTPNQSSFSPCQSTSKNRLPPQQQQQFNSLNKSTPHRYENVFDFSAQMVEMSAFHNNNNDDRNEKNLDDLASSTTGSEVLDNNSAKGGNPFCSAWTITTTTPRSILSPETKPGSLLKEGMQNPFADDGYTDSDESSIVLKQELELVI